MANEYYVRIRGRVSGPFAEERLKMLIQRGQLTRTHEISEDSATWRSAGELEHLFSRPSAGVSKAQSTTGEEQEIDGPSANAAAQPAAPPKAEWYIAVDGARHGPFTLDSLQAKARAGVLPRDSLVWKKGMEEWQSASEVRGLFDLIASGSTLNRPSIAWSDLLPFFRLFNDGAWSLPWVQCLAVALLFPLLVIEYHGIENVQLVGAALAFSLYFSLLWTAFFHWCIQPSHPGPWRLLGVWVFTGTLGVLGVLIAQSLAIPVFGDTFAQGNDASLLKRVIGWTLAVGVIEELGKVCAVLLLTSKMSADATPRTFAYIGVVSGLAFGTTEAVFYTHAYAASHSLGTGEAENDYGVLFMALMTRWISLPLLHAIWTGTAAFWIGLSRYSPSSQWRWILFGLLTVAFLHGLYDVGAGDKAYSWLGVTAAAASLTLFVGYLRSEKTLVDYTRNYQPTAVVEV